MIKEKIIGMLVCIFILLLACSERDETDSLINREIMGKDKVNVSLSLSSLPEMEIEGNTDYRPMGTRAGSGNVRSKINNMYKCLVIKEIGDKWYVDTLLQPTLTNNSRFDNLKVTDDTRFNDLQLTLRPGHYRVLVVLNDQATKWNTALVPGAIVKGESDTVAHAYTYSYQLDPGFSNIGLRELGMEVFAGTAEFTVSKTTDLHSKLVIGDTKINLSRKVMMMRYLLKNIPSEIETFNFRETQYTVFATLKATQSDKPFCDGLDCWGDAYYNRQNPTRELKTCTCLGSYFQKAANGKEYMIFYGLPTITSPFVFSDDKIQVPYELTEIKITGQVDEPRYTYPAPIPSLTLHKNTIQPVVFRTTDKIKDPETYPNSEITLEHLEDESKQDLFDPYFECNHS